uniref:LRRCT domain-containing protein n=1 Tax=Periophthalmus magnuspinnatus TaxID=409849 RepID=A0A3B3Z836_9GOBI
HYTKPTTPPLSCLEGGESCICYTSPSTVSCQNNKIEKLLHGHFSPTTTMLWLYSNNISHIQPSTFHGFDRLEELDLGDNRHLKVLDADTFMGLGRLHALHLYHCGLITLPQGIFAGLHNLQYLYLQLSGSSMTLLPALEYLRLNDNPWECDCKALSLWDWLRRFRGSTSELLCTSPPELKGKDLKSLKKEQLPSCSSGEGHQDGFWAMPLCPTFSHTHTEPLPSIKYASHTHTDTQTCPVVLALKTQGRGQGEVPMPLLFALYQSIHSRSDSPARGRGSLLVL